MSFHENTELHIKSACLFELEQAEKEWGKTYHSLHEGWAVLKEEVEESELSFNGVKSQASGVWLSVKGGDYVWGETCLNSMQENAIQAMKELAQVWAVCEKMKATAKKEE